MEMSRLAAAKRAGVKPVKPLSAKERLAQRKAEARIRAQMPPLPQSPFDHYLRYGY